VEAPSLDVALFSAGLSLDVDGAVLLFSDSRAFLRASEG
jgi:hypothetical protein